MLLKLGEDSDSRPVNDGMDVPAEIARRETRLAALAQAKDKIKQRAAERHVLRPPLFGACGRRMSRGRFEPT